MHTAANRQRFQGPRGAAESEADLSEKQESPHTCVSNAEGLNVCFTVSFWAKNMFEKVITIWWRHLVVSEA